MSSSTGRLIDELPTVSPRPVETQVLAFGMSRTGTMSMQTALHQLGYNSYHVVEAGRIKTFPYWLEALRAMYLGDGQLYKRAEFDKLLGNFSAVTDIPCIMFADELLAAYPNAKVILTERDTESWLVSMQNTFYVLLSWKSFYYLAPLGPRGIDAYWKVLNLVMKIWTEGDIQNRHKLRQTYLNHYAHIRRVVPKDKILDFKLKDDGFEKLCKFLNKPLPTKEQYPNINKPDNIIKMYKTLWWYLLVDSFPSQIEILYVNESSLCAWMQSKVVRTGLIGPQVQGYPKVLSGPKFNDPQPTGGNSDGGSGAGHGNEHKAGPDSDPIEKLEHFSVDNT